AFLPLAQRRRAARQQQPFLGIVGMRLELLLERRHRAGDIAVLALAGGEGALGPTRRIGLVRHGGRAQREIDPGGGGGQQQREPGRERRGAGAGGGGGGGGVGGGRP